MESTVLLVLGDAEALGLPDAVVVLEVVAVGVADAVVGATLGVAGAVVGGVTGAVAGVEQSAPVAAMVMGWLVKWPLTVTSTVHWPLVFHGTSVKVAVAGGEALPTTVSVPPIWVLPSNSWSEAVLLLPSSSATVMVAVPVVLSQDTEPEKSPIWQAKAPPAKPRVSAVAAEATPSVRTTTAVRRDMDTFSPSIGSDQKFNVVGVVQRRARSGRQAGTTGNRRNSSPMSTSHIVMSPVVIVN